MLSADTRYLIWDGGSTDLLVAPSDLRGLALIPSKVVSPDSDLMIRHRRRIVYAVHHPFVFPGSDMRWEANVNSKLLLVDGGVPDFADDAF